MLSPDTYAQPDAPDPIFDYATVLQLVRRHSPSAHEVTAIDESGGEARAYMIDDDLVLKAQRPQQVRERTSLEKEAFFLEHLAGIAGVAVPAVLGYGRKGAVEYICMTRMRGKAASLLDLAPDARAELLRSLGRMLRRIHGVRQVELLANPLFPGPRTAEALRAALLASLNRSMLAIDADPSIWQLRVPVHQVTRALSLRTVRDATLVALHSNPGPEHVFVDPSTFHLTGLIDFGDSYIGHAGFDFRWPAPRDRANLLGGYVSEAEVSDDFMWTWRTAIAIGDLSVIATRPSRRQAASESLLALLSDFADGL